MHNISLLQLSQLVDTEENAISVLQQKGILHSQRTCPKGHQMKLCTTDMRTRWRCRGRTCDLDIGLRQGTWLEHTRLSFRQIVLFIHCWARERTSIEFCAEELGMDDNSVVEWNNNMREVCAETLVRHPISIGCPGMHVEIDESLFSRRKKQCWKSAPTAMGVWRRVQRNERMFSLHCG